MKTQVGTGGMKATGTRTPIGTTKEAKIQESLGTTDVGEMTAHVGTEGAVMTMGSTRVRGMRAKIGPTKGTKTQEILGTSTVRNGME
jgi:hypothetical protein